MRKTHVGVKEAIDNPIFSSSMISVMSCLTDLNPLEFFNTIGDISIISMSRMPLRFPEENRTSSVTPEKANAMVKEILRTVIERTVMTVSSPSSSHFRHCSSGEERQDRLRIKTILYHHYGRKLHEYWIK